MITLKVLETCSVIFIRHYFAECVYISRESYKMHFFLAIFCSSYPTTTSTILKNFHVGYAP